MKAGLLVEAHIMSIYVYISFIIGNAYGIIYSTRITLAGYEFKTCDF